MSIHPSLRSSEKDRKQRSVLKRTERLKNMIEKEQWKEGDTVFGLPKLKTVRIKIKKEKAEKAETVTKEGAAPPSGTEQTSGKASAAPKAK